MGYVDVGLFGLEVVHLSCILISILHTEAACS